MRPEIGWQVRARSKNGWMKASARRGAPPKVDPIVPTEFELLVKRLGIDNELAATHPISRHWIKVHYRTRYVPEGVLDAAGIPEYLRAF